MLWSDSETELQSKPESSYTFNDWNTRAFSAYYGQKLNDAAFYWDKATKLSNASKKQISRALLNKGVALGQLKRPEEAIVEFNKLINLCSNYDNTELRVPCAQALFNKGVALGRLGKHDKAIAAYNEVIKPYGNDADPKIKDLIYRTKNSLDRIKNRR